MMKTKPMLQYLGALNWAIPRCAPYLLRHLQRLQSVASNFSPMHLDEAFKLGQRLYADRYMGITFHGPRSAWWETHDKPDDLMQPYIHVDANLGNQYDSNPQIGAVVMIAGGCVQGSSQRIKLACDSTAYAEMCAAVHGTKIAMQLTSFARDCSIERIQVQIHVRTWKKDADGHWTIRQAPIGYSTCD